MSEKTTSRKPLKVSEPEMKATYDFSGAVRGKHYKRYLEGTNVVVLEPDVAKRFRNSASVNRVLRSFLKNSKGTSRTASPAATRKRAAR